MKFNICAMLAKKVKIKTKITATKFLYLSKKLIKIYEKKSIKIITILCPSIMLPQVKFMC